MRGHIDFRRTGNRSCISCEKTVGAEKKKTWGVEYRSRSEVKSRQADYTKEYWRIRRPTLSKEEKEKMCAATKKWRQNNIERARELERQCSERRKEQRHAYGKEYQRKYPERAAVKERNKRARIRQNGGIHTVDDVAEIIKMQKHKCAYCRGSVKEKYHVDHIVPIVKNGKNDRSNLQILCPSCNHKKHSKDPIDFARSMGKLL